MSRAGACLFLVVMTGGTAAPAIDPLLSRIDAAAKRWGTLKGEFTQTSRIRLFKQELESRGRFFYRRPQRLRWELLEPDSSTLVLDGDRASLSTPGSPARSFDLARDPSMRTLCDQLLLWLGSGSLSQARAAYDLAASGSAAEPVLTLTPRAGSPVARIFQRITLRFDGKTLLLHGLSLVEQNGDEKVLRFHHLVPNAPISDATFRL